MTDQRPATEPEPPPILWEGYAKGLRVRALGPAFGDGEPRRTEFYDETEGWQRTTERDLHWHICYRVKAARVVALEAALKEQRELWREYASLLVDAAIGPVGLALAHGWRGSSPEIIQRGRELRAALGIQGAEDGHADVAHCSEGEPAATYRHTEAEANDKDGG